MLTTDQFQNWLFDLKGDDVIVLCQGVTPSFLSQMNPDFAKVYASVQYAADRGFVYIDAGKDNSWVARRHITPKRVA